MDQDQLSARFAILQAACDLEGIDALARETQFLQRLRKIRPADLALALVSSLSAFDPRTITELHDHFMTLCEVEVDYKAFYKRLNRDSFVTFFSSLFERWLNLFLTRMIEPIPDHKLAAFDDIWLQDGSSISLRDTLADIFPGRFTRYAPAAIEIHATQSLLSDNLISLSVAPDTVGERDFLPEPQELSGLLLLQDCGYQDLERAADVAAAGGDVLSRAKNNLNPTIVSLKLDDRFIHEVEGRKLKDCRWMCEGHHVDLIGRWKKGMWEIDMRLVGIYDPDHERHLWLYTTLEASDWNVEELHTLYRLRWQVELLFKELKSCCELKGFGTSKAPIAEGLIWVALSSCILKRFLVQSSELVYETKTQSTLKGSRRAPILVLDLMRALLDQCEVAPAFSKLLKYFARENIRSRPKRDAQRGKFQMGLISAVHADSS